MEHFQKIANTEEQMIVKLDGNEFELFRRLEKYSKPREQTILTQMFYCIQADRYEWCHEFALPNNLFYGKDKMWLQEYEKKFFKWVGTYYVLEFCAQKTKNVEEKDLELAFLITLKFQKKERELFYKLKLLKQMENPFFQIEIAKYIVKKLVHKKDPSIQELAMACHFLNDGYVTFINLFQRYYD